MKLNFTFDALKGAASALERLDSLDLRLSEREKTGEKTEEKNPLKVNMAAGDGFARRVADARAAVFASLEDDLNTAGALGALFTFVKATNVDLEAGHLSGADAALARGLLREVAGDIFGVMPGTAAADSPSSSSPSKKPPSSESSSSDEPWILDRIEARKAAKKVRDFKAADAIRDELFASGIVLEDTPQGVRWKRKA
jgi:cysteinyl-tRNA synthetase